MAGAAGGVVDFLHAGGRAQDLPDYAEYAAEQQLQDQLLCVHDVHGDYFLSFLSFFAASWVGPKAPSSCLRWASMRGLSPSASEASLLLRCAAGAAPLRGADDGLTFFMALSCGTINRHRYRNTAAPAPCPARRAGAGCGPAPCRHRRSAA